MLMNDIKEKYTINIHNIADDNALCTMEKILFRIK